jgi:hypothetical protein
MRVTIFESQSGKEIIGTVENDRTYQCNQHNIIRMVGQRFNSSTMLFDRSCLAPLVITWRGTGKVSRIWQSRTTLISRILLTCGR